jgi:hypothetical protein
MKGDVMNNILKNILVILVSVSPALAIAAEQAAPAPAAKVASNKSEHKKPEMLTLVGVTKDNRSGIEKLAKENGAHKASLDVKTGSLKISGGDFKKDQFQSKLTTDFPGVSVK